MKLTNNLCLRLSKEQIIEIKKMSEELGIAKSSFCRMAVINFIKQTGLTKYQYNEKL
jgi:hypothetical protein